MVGCRSILESSDRGPRWSSKYGVGVPFTTQLRTNQYPPESARPPHHAPAVHHRRARTARNTTPTVTTAAGAATVSLKPRPIPAAIAATAVGAGWRPLSNSNASAARNSAPVARSLDADPGWVATSVGSPSTTTVATTHSAPTPRRRPTHHAASTANAAQPRLSSGDRKSLPNGRIAMAWERLELSGRKECNGVARSDRPESLPVCTNRPANGPWYQSVSPSVMPRPHADATYVNHCDATRATASTAATISSLGSGVLASARSNSSPLVTPKRGATAPIATPTKRQPNNMGKRSKTPNEPRSWPSPTGTATAITISARRAGGPDHSGITAPRRRQAPHPSAPATARTAADPPRYVPALKAGASALAAGRAGPVTGDATRARRRARHGGQGTTGTTPPPSTGSSAPAAIRARTGRGWCRTTATRRTGASGR